MPRAARVKNESGIYHIIIRSISEVNLFKDDDDKIIYMKMLKEAQNMYMFKVYGYCLMTTHGHFIIDTCGADISRIMHKINFKYAIYYNKKYKRHGHLFQDRFKSKLVNNMKYLNLLSLYIHSNPLDIDEYKNNIERYRFSSLRVYLGTSKDEFEILDHTFILGFYSNDINQARKNYRNVLANYSKTEIEHNDFNGDGNLYISGRYVINRNNRLNDVIEFVCKKLNMSEELLYIKYSRKSVRLKSIVILLMRNLCNFKIKDICKVLGNITISRVTALSSIGMQLAYNDNVCQNIIKEFVEKSMNRVE